MNTKLSPSALPDLEAWGIFAEAAQLGSFAAGARSLGLSRPTVSRAIARLEESLGVALFQRTSRQLALTPAGQRALIHASALLEAGRGAQAALLEEASQPRGRLKIAAPATFGLRYLAPLLPEFLERYPHIDLDVVFSDRRVNLLEEGFDLALRIGVLQDSTLRARMLGAVARFLVASPQWLETHPELNEAVTLRQTQVQALLETSLRVAYTGPEGLPLSVTLKGPEGTLTLTARQPRLTSNNAESFVPWLEAGGGVGLLPSFMSAESLARGTLVRVLPHWEAEPVPMHFLMPPSPQHTARLTAFMDWLAPRLKPLCALADGGAAEKGGLNS